VQWLPINSGREATAALMSHPQVGLVLATGGRAMVKAAYRSGTPAIGVGPGNAPVLISLRAGAAAAEEMREFCREQIAHLNIQATALGLWMHQIGGFDQEQARDSFAIPDGYEPATWIAIGELGDHALLPAALREREQAPRTRKPLRVFVFGGCWGQPAPLPGLDI
jgi:hypothetical protein